MQTFKQDNHFQHPLLQLCIVDVEIQGADQLQRSLKKRFVNLIADPGDSCIDLCIRDQLRKKYPDQTVVVLIDPAHDEFIELTLRVARIRMRVAEPLIVVFKFMINNGMP